MIEAGPPCPFQRVTDTERQVRTFSFSQTIFSRRQEGRKEGRRDWVHNFHQPHSGAKVKVTLAKTRCHVALRRGARPVETWRSLSRSLPCPTRAATKKISPCPSPFRAKENQSFRIPLIFLSRRLGFGSWEWNLRKNTAACRRRTNPRKEGRYKLMTPIAFDSSVSLCSQPD
jgi:hypothetical protein